MTAAASVTHPFLSDAFLADVRYVADRARELGLRLDLTLGSGWPFGGPQVGIAQAAGRLRVERVAIPAGAAHVPLPDIRSGERLLAVFVGDASPLLNLAGLREVVDVADGMVRLPDRRQGPREAIVFISGRTGMMVKRAAVGAEGFVLNHLDRTAVDRYLHEVGDRLLSPFGPNLPYAIFCDSLEVYESDWTDDFLDVFRARRGYDLRPLLPALVLDGGATSAAVRHDWGQTLTELVDERFLSPVQDWARRHGTRFRVQSYGIPPATISSSAGVDLPEGEGAQWKMLQASRWAASIGHLYGRPVISSETWTWLHSPVFMASPLDMKAEADVHFLQGINQLVGHGWPYSADGVAYPGWRFYAAGAFNDKNPWWVVMPDVSRYLQRVSFLLRQGLPANDVAVYLPTDDTWSRFVPGKAGSFIEAMSQARGPGHRRRHRRSGLQPGFRGRHRAGDGAHRVGAAGDRAEPLPGDRAPRHRAHVAADDACDRVVCESRRAGAGHAQGSRDRARIPGDGRRSRAGGGGRAAAVSRCVGARDGRGPRCGSRRGAPGAASARCRGDRRDERDRFRSPPDGCGRRLLRRQYLEPTDRD